MTSGDHNALVQRQFGTAAANYKVSAIHARGKSLERLVDLLHPQSDWLVLDVATGAGHTAASLAPHVETVIAGDMTWEMLGQAVLVCSERRLTNVRFVRESAGALSYADKIFDLVTCRIAAHHFPNTEVFIRECARVLKPEGALAVVDNIVPDDKASADWINDFERRRDPSHVRCLSPTQWHKSFARNGIAIVHSEVNSKWFDLEQWMQRMNVNRDTAAALEQALFEAPRPVRDFWQPTHRDDVTRLALREITLIGRLAP